ncbi:SusC/RagA family TonB-linked outer membrane protein [Bacteroides cellulosilyticus]|jgi:TonB-linked SusC/RagA family outer membrane protein|nr:SusC/RagA family TonB-linked outer membrane protein [Bacteroides cellulosilyticus]MBV3663955.1 SusC/RagA family TonB-linked outer membrane protein [Bacteroides cellulosilyticus]MBV3685910.1 SusC/RagA family TonB-linked outer membrane protein [Bacteroides cellulosilyticus]MBV3694952.1 SusC/RagA family TonB-linked outer membrane protein [Bacteroides cellulosilyticus]MBV3708207.1 SusC/RagA family TonB-linked outer membrane protein [Bacteroides cellulosilyticus]
MQTQEVLIKPNVKVFMKADAEMLDEVIVVAYGTAKKESLTGSISVVDSKKIEKRITTSVTGALEGSAPGVQVNNTYGEPGKAPSIRIRGFGTLVSGASDPLFIVDGVPFDGNIAELNSNDIESMSILKDAASAALYGNRAANGVVLITTKSGRGSDKPSITLQINQGIYNRGISEYERLGADQWMEASWKAMKNYAMTGSLGLGESDAAAYATKNIITGYARRNIYDAADDALFDANGNLIANKLSGYDDLDWAKDIERNGYRQEYNLSASSSGDKLSVYSSVGYLNEKGYVIASGYERFSGRVNSTYTPNKWIKAGLNLSGSTTKRDYNDNATGEYYANPFYITRYMAPVYPLFMHNADGSYALDELGNKQYDVTSSYLSNRNIAYELRNNKEESRRNVLGGQAFVTVNLPYDFSVTVKGDLNNSTSNNTKYDNPKIGDGATNNGRLTSYAYQYTNYTMQQLINWKHSYKNMHNVDVMLGHENYSWERKYTSGMNTGMAVDGNLTMGNFLTNSFFNGSDDEYKTESYLARARYNYDERYFAEASFRRDGSSRFHPDNRWGNFFSVGASWNIKREAFMQDIDWIDHLKFRASYGEVGNDAGVNYYGYMALYTIDKNGGEAALLKKSLSAPDIKWETTQTLDFALEGRLFDRLNFQIGYFDKRSKDLLFEVRLPLSAGSYPWVDTDNGAPMNLTQYKNIGTVSNRGVEIALDADAINTRDWKWNIGLDATFLKNKVVKLPDGKDILRGMQNYSEGHSIYEFYTYHFAGVDQMTGQSLYTIDPEKKEDAAANNALTTIDGTDYTTITTYGKRDWAGSALPKVYGSIHSAVSWKDLSLNILFTYGLGGKVYDGSYHSLMSTSAMSSGSALHKDALKSWDGVPEGMTETSANRIDPNGVPALDFNRSTDNNATSDRWLTSASYLVFKNLNLSYSLPKSWMNRWGISGLTLTAGIENLFTVTARKGLNPQFSFNGTSDDTYVTARVYNLGLTVKF